MASSERELFDAISRGDVERVQTMLDADPSLASARDEEGVSALMRARYRLDRDLLDAVRAHLDELDVFEAAALGDLAGLTAELDVDPSAVAARSADGFTPLHLAAFFRQTDAVALLLARGADVDARGTGWMTGTALHAATGGHDREAARLLLESGADPNLRQAEGYTPLHAASHNGDAELVDLLLEHGADPRLTTDAGEDAVAIAEASGDAATIEVLRQATA